MVATTIVLSALVGSALAVAEPTVTAAPRLHPRQSDVDPALVGYMSASDGYENGRTCDYPQTMSTSGSFAQCCPASGACPFYTACSSNTLLAASASGVPCDANPGLACNTAVLATTAGASGGASYLACWQATLGSEAFTFVQDIGSATVAAAATSTKESGSSSASQAPATASDTASTTQSASHSSGSKSSASITSSESSASASATTAAGSVSSSASLASSASAADSASAPRGHGSENVVVGVVALLARFLL